MTSEELNEIMERLGLSQTKLAQLTGNDVRTVRRWMNNEAVPSWLPSWLEMYEKIHGPADKKKIS
jgi:DNA-binding transcriptional regulator YiaG